MAAENLTREGRGKRMKTDDDHPCCHLPLEVIMENIVTRVSIRDVMSCSCVCKLWYQKILKDPHFASAYLEKSSSQKSDASLFFSLLNISIKRRKKHPLLNCFYSLDDEDVYFKGTEMDIMAKPFYVNYFHLTHRLSIGSKAKFEVMGHCNGLICILQSYSKTKGAILIVNPSRKQTLFITRPIIDGYTIICYGLGFDSLTHEYKLVLIARSSTTTTDHDGNNGDTIQGSNDNELLFKCLVFTLGKNSWRETTTSTTIPLLLEGKTSTSFYKSSIFSGGSLFWRTRSLDKRVAAAAAGNKILSFDLRNDKFQVIPLPAECDSSKFSMLEQKYQIVDPLLVYKGYPCVARLGKTILTGGGGGGGGGGETTTIMDDKVHLHILKDNVRQLWIKETFDIATVEPLVSVSPAVSCFIINLNNPPPTRIVCSYGQVFIYCFDGHNLQIYNLQTKRVKFATGSHRHLDTFEKKERSPAPRNYDDDNNLINLYEKMDYHLSSHIDNFLVSLQAFLPKGAPKIVAFQDIESILDYPQTTFVGYLCVTGDQSNDYYLF